MSHADELYIGLISGTSADCIDAALVDFSQSKIRLVASHGHTIPTDIQSAIYALMLPGDNEVDRLGQLDQELGDLFAAAAQQVLTISNISAKRIKAIGSHGQTIRHRPRGQLARAFTLQLADPNLICETTGITTVADFRRRDMAAGGQGAPLVPAFHRAVFASPEVERIIVNIGGISNITHLHHAHPVLGFDTGPGNALMDEWIAKHQQQRYDADGTWARSGNINQPLLQDLLSHPYFAEPAPKSTGREIFTLPWLEQTLKSHNAIAPHDVQRTLLELTAASIQQHIAAVAKTDSFEVYICGGGAYNGFLMERLQAHLPNNSVGSSQALGIDPNWVEAMAFAWLARQTLNALPGNVPSVTGATRELILGGIYVA